MSPDAASRTDQLLTEALPLAKKVEGLRNQIYAHQSAGRTVAEVYADEQPTLDEHARLVCLAMDLMNEIRSVIGLATTEVSKSHIQDFFWTMDAIKMRALADG